LPGAPSFHESETMLRPDKSSTHLDPGTSCSRFKSHLIYIDRWKTNRA